jgi:hypothetical protein
MNRPLPPRIVAALDSLAADLADWCRQGRDHPLDDHETAVLERVRAVLPTLLAAVVETTTTDLDARLADAPAACPRCGATRRPHETARGRQVQTRCGPVTLARPWYHCARCQHGFSPVDTTLQLAPRARVSDGLRAWLVRLGTSTVFREASDLLETLTGLALAPETVRRCTEQAGTAVADAEDANTGRVEQTREPAEPVDPAPGLLVVQTDGAQVRYLDGWHEVKLGLVAGWQDDQLRAVSYVAAREPAERFGARLAAEAARRGALEVVRWTGPVTGRGLAVLRPVQILGDGAPWIWNLAAERFDARIETVDFWHANQHLQAAAVALFGEGAAATAWADARGAELLVAGIAPLLEHLRQARAPTPEAAELLRRERGYFTTNAARMAYPLLRLEGLPVGSGAIESAADHLLQRRMKRAGMRWSEPGARAVIALRARLRSGRSLSVSATNARHAPSPKAA